MLGLNPIIRPTFTEHIFTLTLSGPAYESFKATNYNGMANPYFVWEIKHQYETSQSSVIEQSTPLLVQSVSTTNVGDGTESPTPFIDMIALRDWCNTNIPNMVCTTGLNTITWQWTQSLICGQNYYMCISNINQPGDGIQVSYEGERTTLLNISCAGLPIYQNATKSLRIGLKTPKNIPGLRLWFDAADSSTINDGTTTHGTNVSTFIDKVSGVIMRNNNGVSGPTYSWGVVNGKNAIHMPYYSSSDTSLKALTASNLTMLDGLTYSMYCIYKPMTTIQDDTLGNQKYVVTIYSDTRINQINAPGGYANRAIYTGDEGGTTNATRRLNPSGRYIEGDSTTNAPYNDYVTYGEHVPSRHSVAPTSLGKTCITTVRVQPYLKKLGFGFDGYDFYEDISSSRLTEYSSRGIRLNRESLSVGTNATLIFGSPWWRTANKANKLYPLEGYFCEFLYFDRFLTDSEANSVRQYLHKKWIG